MTEQPRVFTADMSDEQRALRLRLLILRTHAAAGQGHLGSSLSLVEILAALLGPGAAQLHEQDPTRGDRLVLSKGHAALGLYCALAEAGVIPHEMLTSFGKNGSVLEPHPNETLLPAVAVSTGSLGQGLSIGLGLAHASLLAGHAHERTTVILGDGELNEGQPWEAAIAAVHLRLGNLLAIVDANGLQQDGRMNEIMPIAALGEAWRALGWRVYGADGHDCAGLSSLFAALRDQEPEAPKLVIARTIKARGVPFLENTAESHYPPALDAAEIDLVARMLTQGGAHG